MGLLALNQTIQASLLLIIYLAEKLSFFARLDRMSARVSSPHLSFLLIYAVVTFARTPTIITVNMASCQFICAVIFASNLSVLALMSLFSTTKGTKLH